MSGRIPSAIVHRRWSSGSLWPCVCSLLMCWSVPAVEQPTAASLDTEIDSVLVYSQGAHVNRAGSLALPAGTADVILRSLPAGIISGSVRIAVTGVEGVRLQSVREELVPQQRVDPGLHQQLSDKRDALDLQKQGLDDQRKALTNRIELLKAVISQSPKQKSDSGDERIKALATSSWSRMLGFVETDMQSSLASLRSLNEKSDGVQLQLRELHGRLKQLEKTRQPASLAVRMRVDVPVAGTVHFTVAYDIAQASWYPSYTFQVDGSSGRTDMIRSAWVAQASGEDWTDVAVTVSTAMPVRVSRLPELHTWRIGGTGQSVEPSRAGRQAPRAAVIQRPDAIAAAQSAFMDHPFARRSLRLADSFGYQGGGSYEQAFMAIGAGGGASGAFGNRSGGGRKRAIGRYGGSKASESAVEGVGRYLIRVQSADGRWASADHGGQSSQEVGDTALSLLSFLGAGYEHRTPNRYRDAIARGLQWLIQQQRGNGGVGHSLWNHTLATTALAEAYAMTNDPELAGPAQRAVDALSRMLVATPFALQADLHAGSWPSHPANLAFVVLALKSAKAGGLRTDEMAWVQAFAYLNEIEKLQRTPTTIAGILATRIFTGHDMGDEAVQRDVEALMEVMPTAWQDGAYDIRLMFLGSLAIFQAGGSAWKKWNEHVRDIMVNAQIRTGDEKGSWDPIGLSLGMSRIASTALMTLALQTYYRYLPVTPARSSGGGTGTRHFQVGGSDRVISPYLSAGGRDLRWTGVQQDTLPGDGAYKPIILGRQQLQLQLEHEAVPLAFHGAFLRGRAVYTGEQILPGGEARIQLGSDSIGSIVMDTVQPGEELFVPLGIDPAVTLTRNSSMEESSTGFRGKLQRQDYRVALAVSNTRSTPVNLIIRDRVPRPADARIRVVDLKHTPEPEQYDEDSRLGELRFRVQVPAQGSSQVKISYAVELPQELNIVGRERDHD